MIFLREVTPIPLLFPKQMLFICGLSKMGEITERIFYKREGKGIRHFLSLHQAVTQGRAHEDSLQIGLDCLFLTLQIKEERSV